MKDPNMFICKRTPEGTVQVLEGTKEVLDDFLRSTAVLESQASCDAALMILTNGADVKGHKDGIIWYRTVPTIFTPAPRHCNLSNQLLGDVAYDAKTKYGGWCMMSQQSWEQHGCGKLGAGYGQKYLRSTTGDYYLTEGMSRLPQPHRAAA